MVSCAPTDTSDTGTEDKSVHDQFSFGSWQDITEKYSTANKAAKNNALPAVLPAALTVFSSQILVFWNIFVVCLPVLCLCLSVDAETGSFTLSLIESCQTSTGGTQSLHACSAGKHSSGY